MEYDVAMKAQRTGWLSRAWDSASRSQEFEPHIGCRGYLKK